MFDNLKPYNYSSSLNQSLPSYPYEPEITNERVEHIPTRWRKMYNNLIFQNNICGYIQSVLQHFPGWFKEKWNKLINLKILDI